MRALIIRQGDFLTRLAFEQGFDADAAWGHDANADLRQRRETMDTLQSGDVLRAPPRVSRPRLTLTCGVPNGYVAAIPCTTFSVRFQRAMVPMVNEPCTVSGPDGSEFPDQTDADGRIEFQVPLHQRQVRVSFEARGAVFWVRVGHMDPSNERSGVIARLMNLGYMTSPHDEFLSSALRRFQRDRSMPVTGHADEDTMRALLDAHGS